MNHQVNGLTTVSDLLATSLLEVPPFQRAYAWDPQPHVRDFLDDLTAHPTTAATPYFLGTILLTSVSPDAGVRFRQYAVVDGQQRMTSACILVASALQRLSIIPGHDNELINDCRDLFVRSAVGNRRKFHTIKEDEPFFDRFILGSEQPQDTNITAPSQRRLWDAKRYILGFLDDRNIESIAAMLRTLIRSQILIYAVNTSAEATQVFELQNDRGKRLTDLEALKSFLMHGLYISSHENVESDLNVVQQNFADIYRAAEKIESHVDGPADDDILQYHCIAFEGWLTLEGDVPGWHRPKELVKKIVSSPDKRGPISTAEWIKRCSNRLKDTFTATLQILEARDTVEAMGDLTALRRVAPFWPLLLKCWRTDGTGNHSLFERAVRAMERFALRSAIAGKRSGMGGSKLRVLARDFSDDFGGLLRDLEKMRSGWGIEWGFEEGLNSRNFYGYERLATYLLWSYENYLRKQPGHRWPLLSWRTLVSPATDAERFEKDHIEPKDVNNPKLAELVTWDPNNPDELPRPFGEVFLHRLGNLVLDCVSPGASKGNRNFEARIFPYSNGTALLSQQELVSRFASKTSDGSRLWDEAAIRSRHKALVDFAKSRW
jgi:hypothetical protein